MNFIKKNLFTLILVLAVFTIMPAVSFAQCSNGTNPVCSDGSAPPCAVGQATCNGTNPVLSPTSCPAGTICNPISSKTINDFIQTILIGVIKIGIPIVALAIIYSGFLFVAARGNSEKLEEAKRALLYSVIGAAILLGSWALAQLINSTILSL